MQADHRVGRQQLVQETARRLGIPRRLTNQVITTFIDQLSLTLSDGHSVTLSHDGLGRFDVVETPERKLRNPQNQEWLVVPRHKRVVFRPSEYLKSTVKEGERS